MLLGGPECSHNFSAIMSELPYQQGIAIWGSLISPCRRRARHLPSLLLADALHLLPSSLSSYPVLHFVLSTITYIAILQT